MKSIVDREMIRRRATYAHTASLGGLLLLLASVVLPLFKPNLATPAVVLLIIGFSVSAAGVYLANTWVKKPRPEDSMEKALKGLSDSYRLYHYLLPCEHLLLTPSGLVVLETINLDGSFSYTQGRWKQKMSMNRALRFVFDERLGDPIARAQRCCEQIQHRLESKLGDGFSIPVSPVVVFINPSTELEVDKAPIPVVTNRRLEKSIPRNQNRLPGELYRQIQDILDQAAASRSHKI